MSNTRIYQIYYRPEQRKALDPSFEPYDNCANPSPDWAEYHVFRSQLLSCVAQEDGGAVGYVSWKFRQKTGIKGADFLDFIGRHPGFDTYFVNPFEDRYNLHFKNPFYQGERVHPGILDFTESTLRKAGHSTDLRHFVVSPDQTAYCNYFAGTAGFWKKYFAFLEPVYAVLQGPFSEREERFLEETRATNPSGLTVRAYIMERMFSLLLATDRSIRAVKMPIPLRPDAFDPERALILAQEKKRLIELTEPVRLQDAHRAYDVLSDVVCRGWQVESKRLVQSARALDHWLLAHPYLRSPLKKLTGIRD